jgi:hypothetical protein
MFSEQRITQGVKRSGRSLILHLFHWANTYIPENKTDVLSVASKNNRLEADAANSNHMVVSLTELEAKSKHKDT